jgi:hypothetical protein
MRAYQMRDLTEDVRSNKEVGMAVRLDPSIREQFLAWDDYAVVLEVGSDGEAGVLLKAPATDIHAWRGLPVFWQWTVGLYPSGAPLRLHLAVIDPSNGRSRIDFEAETFLNPVSPADRRVIDALLGQESITVHFFDGQMTHQRSTRYESHQEHVPQIARMIQAADRHLAALNVSQLDFALAKKRMMADCPMAFAERQKTRSTL